MRPNMPPIEKLAKSRDAARVRAEQQAIAASITDGTAFSVVQMFLPVCRQWEEIETIYAERGVITQTVS